MPSTKTNTFRKAMKHRKVTSQEGKKDNRVSLTCEEKTVLCVKYNKESELKRESRQSDQGKINLINYIKDCTNRRNNMISQAECLSAK